MSLGGHFSKGRTAIFTASAPWTPREPLLFLYPRWTRNASSPSAQPAEPDHSTSQSVHRSLSVPAYSHKSLLRDESGASGALRENGPHAKVTFIEGSGGWLEEERKSRRPANLLQRPKKKFNSSFSGYLEPQIRKIYLKDLESKEHQEIARRARQAWQARNRAKRGVGWEPDWRVILSDLWQHTADHKRWLEKALVVAVPKNAISTILYGIDDNVFSIGRSYDCVAEFEAQDETSAYQNVFLSGSPNAISKTAAHILQIAPQAKLNAAKNAASYSSISLENHSGDVQTGVMQSLRNGSLRFAVTRKSRKIPVMRADKLPRPLEWTPDTFTDYVEDLTRMRGPFHVNRLMYRGRKDHIATVLEILHKIFLEPECRSSLTRTAFNMAIQYFMKTTHVLDARIFFVHMEMMKIPMDVETFNILLRGAAKSEDLHNFAFILNLMLKRKISPNGTTWYAFLRCLPDLRVKLYAFNKMKEKGLLRNWKNVIEACTELVVHEIATSLDRGQSQTEFLSHMDARYGPQWLSDSASLSIISAMAGRGLISRCWEFLFVMQNRHIKIDEHSVNTVLFHCKQHGNVIGAIEYLRSLPHFVDFRPDEFTYHVLFEMAWRKRSYNLAKVVWRYACLDAATTFMMRTRVLVSLRNSYLIANPRAKRARGREIFGHAVGTFITSNRDILNHPAVVIQREFKNITGFEMLEDPVDIPYIQQKTRPRFMLPKVAPFKWSEATRIPHFHAMQPVHSIGAKLEIICSKGFSDGKTPPLGIVNEDSSEPVSGLSLEFQSGKPQDRVKDPLKAYTAPEPTNPVAHDAQTSRPDILDLIVVSPLQDVTDWLPESDEHVEGVYSGQEPLAPIKAFLNYECQVFQWWKPVIPLADILLQAWEMDQEWRDPLVRGNLRRINWMIDNSVSIPICAVVDNKPYETEWR